MSDCARIAKRGSASRQGWCSPSRRSSSGWCGDTPTRSSSLLPSRGSNGPYYAAAVAALFAYQILRTLRTRRLLDAPLSFSKLFDTVCILSLINSYFLAGLGDIGMVYLLNRRHGVALHIGAATFIMAGIADLAVFMALFLVVIVIMAELIPGGVYLVIAGVGGALIVGIGAILLLGRILNWETLATLSRRTGAIAWTARFALSFAEALQALRTPRVLLPVLGQSTLMWGFHYLQWLFILRAIGLTLSPIEVLWIYLLAFAASFLPVRGLAAMGPRIAVWFFSLRLMGVRRSTSCDSGSRGRYPVANARALGGRRAGPISTS